jgi:DNA-binding CsgD family transcriptional regulator
VRVHDQRSERLSEREIEVIRLLARGYTNKDIAQTLVLSVRTVEAHLRTVYGKIGARPRTAAALGGQTRVSTRRRGQGAFAGLGGIAEDMGRVHAYSVTTWNRHERIPR